MQKWYDNKVVWMNGFLTLSGILTLVSDYIQKSGGVVTAAGVLMTVVGGLGVVLRVWFTDSPVTQPFLKKPTK